MEISRNENFIIRPAEKKDVKTILQFVTELAEYENMPDQVFATEDNLQKSLFIDKSAEVIIGEYLGEPIGFALFFHNYSTWEARSGIYLEDLYIRPEMRGRGLGKVMLIFLAKLAKERGCARFEWSCLNWNEPSIKFYEKLGAKAMKGWTVYRLSGKDLDNLADSKL